jgi:hypothetical protein
LSKERNVTNPDPVAEIKRLLNELAAKRAAHEAAIAEIDETLASLGLSSVQTAAPRRGRKPGVKGAKRGPKPGSKREGGRRRGRFEKSGEESVFEFVKSFGTPNAKEVNEHWTNEGRAGKADNALGKLVKNGQLKRVEVKGERGSRYKVA